ncbi:hypothetical protein [Hymenobacter terricola]|uniref:hypothetical protein n=1 Tax=Hymenobacter terricola TaxID=2819236 RepID=UPI001B302623|nr:hypothetical protein [Hymenobacter terricola]
MRLQLYSQLLCFLLLGYLLVGASCESRSKKNPVPTAPNAGFAKLLRHLHQAMCSEQLGALPVIFRDSNNVYTDEHHYKRVLEYELRLAERPLGLRCQTIQLRNPFGPDAFPLANSIVYQNHLIALFSPGQFACFRLPGLERDTQMEQQLNVQLFERHQTLNQQLIGWHQGRAYYFDNSRRAWQPDTDVLPFNQWPTLFEDELYVCTKDCQGEFGGSLYFFNKQTKRVTRTDATCATAVWKQDGRYQVLASLPHMLGHARRGAIQSPESLAAASLPRNPAKTWEYDLSDVLPDPTVKRVFSFIMVLMPGAFRWNNQTFYLVDWRNATFVATIKDRQITIVDPLFSNSLDTHHAVTTNYPDNTALTTIPRFYSKDKEAACLLIHNGLALQVEWSARQKLPY